MQAFQVPVPLSWHFVLYFNKPVEYFRFAPQWCHSLLYSSSLFLPTHSHPHPLFPPSVKPPLPSGICTCCSPATTWCRLRVGSSTQRLTHFLSSTWATSPCPAASRLSGRRTGHLPPPQHQGAPLYARLPAQNPTRQHWTNLHSTLQTLNCFRTADINQRRRRESLARRPLRRGEDFWVSPRFFYVLLFDTLCRSLCLLCFNQKDGGCCCSASRLAGIDSEGPSSKSGGLT